MAIRFSGELLNPQDLVYYQQEFGTDVRFVQKIVLEAEKLLATIGITDAEMSLITDITGQVKFGSTRIPILVTLPDGTHYVIKRYDVRDPVRERESLNMLQGICVGRVLLFAEEFFIEEYIDPKEYVSLEELADLGQQEAAFQRLGEVAAVLASLGVVDNHSHLMDEVFINNAGLVRITDVGHVERQVAEDESSMLIEVEKFKALKSEDEVGAALKYFKSILTYRGYPIANSLDSIALQEYEFTLQKFADMVGEVKFVQLCPLLRTVLFAIKFFNQGRQIIYPWKKATRDFSPALNAFIDKYSSLPKVYKVDSIVSPVSRELIQQEQANLLVSIPMDIESGHQWIEKLIKSGQLRINRSGGEIFVSLSPLHGDTTSFYTDFPTDKKFSFSSEKVKHEESFTSWLNSHGVYATDEYISRFLRIVDSYITGLYFST